jgi:hypothetical protein
MRKKNSKIKNSYSGSWVSCKVDEHVSKYIYTYEAGCCSKAAGI